MAHHIFSLGFIPLGFCFLVLISFPALDSSAFNTQKALADLYGKQIII